MTTYLKLLRHIMERGKDRTDRTGVGTRSVFGYQWRHDLQNGFPLLTTKKIHTRSVFVELLWFLSGNSNIRALLLNGCTIWTEWCYKPYCAKSEAVGKTPLSQAEFEQMIIWDENFARTFGSLGPVYGYQWRFGSGTDQIAKLLEDLKKNPDSRRHIVSAWNPQDVPLMALPPCHTLWQCYVEKIGAGDSYIGGYKLSLHLYARSIDAFLGLPFNIASYAALLRVLAHYSDYYPGDLIISFGDLHIYQNHFNQVKEQLSRMAMALPALTLSEMPKDWRTLEPSMWEKFQVNDYTPLPSIKAPIAV